ncbi:MAG: histidinol phosphate phosphatase domain-containing protein [Candidatus Goldbacteria bacterium]|nr:histidinol phosphate phosphatase domain-containing protein [Candidatus Goldiibacteriota bacterium]
MIDLHTHTFFSDGDLLPSELIQRARKAGYEAIAITDHVDSSNIEEVIKSVKKACADANRAYKDIKCFTGVEITHVAPVLVRAMVLKARKLGADVVVFHGETVVEPVEPGSNRAAIEAGVDILAHPGLITPEDALLAAKKNVFLEITARDGHNKTNNHVASIAGKMGAKIVFNTDTHTPNNIVTDNRRKEILKKSGLNDDEILSVIKNSEIMVKKMLKNDS